jgi:hypothetical protein
MWLDSVVSQGKHAWCLRVDEGIGIVSEDIVEHPRARWCPAWAWAWAWAWVWVWAWASIAYKAETYLTQPSSEGGRMGVGEDIEDVGWHRGVKWVLACGQG